MVNTCGKVHPAHLALVVKEQLFLKRNLRAVCRENLKKYTRNLLKEAMAASGVAVASGAAGGGVATSSKRERWVILKSACDDDDMWVKSLAHGFWGGLRMMGCCVVQPGELLL